MIVPSTLAAEPYTPTPPVAASCLRRLKEAMARFMASSDNDDSSSRRDAGAFALHLFGSISTMNHTTTHRVRVGQKQEQRDGTSNPDL